MNRIAFGLTDIGRRRLSNEDSFLVDNDLGLYVVADGMGGHNAGEVASGEAVDALHCMVRQQEDALQAIEALPKDTSFGRKMYWEKESKTRFQLSAVVMKTDRTSMHRPQICSAAQGWKIEKTETIDIPMASPHPYTLSATCLTVLRAKTSGFALASSTVSGSSGHPGVSVV